MSSSLAKWMEPEQAHAGEVRKLSTLLEASQALSSTLDLKQGLHRVLEILGRHHGALRSTVVLLNEDTGEVEVEAAAGRTVAAALRDFPEVVQCVLLSGRYDLHVVVATADPAETARGYIHDFHRGALKLVGDRDRGVLIGATLVTPRAGEIVGELVLAIKLGTPLNTLADVIHPFPAFNRMLGESLNQLAARVAGKGEHHEQNANQH